MSSSLGSLCRRSVIPDQQNLFDRAVQHFAVVEAPHDTLKRVTTTTLQFQPTAARSRRMVFRVSLAAHARSNSYRATKRCKLSHPSLGEGHATPRVTAASAEDDAQTGASCTRPATVVRRCSHERRRDAGKLALRHGQSGWMDGWEVRKGIKKAAAVVFFSPAASQHR